MPCTTYFLSKAKQGVSPWDLDVIREGEVEFEM